MAHFQPLNYKHNNGIDLKIKDIESLHGSEFLNDGVLSFVVKYLNFLNLETSTNTTIHTYYLDQFKIIVMLSSPKSTVNIATF